MFITNNLWHCFGENAHIFISPQMEEIHMTTEQNKKNAKNKVFLQTIVVPLRLEFSCK